MAKYSIIIPVRNALEYLPHCLNTITSQRYDDYEVIISDNCSDDGTSDYIKSLTDSHFKTIKTPQKFEIADSWDFAIKHAAGEWLIGLGADDGLMPYFFQLADILTNYCNKKNLSIIKSNRSYFFWQGKQVDETYKIKEFVSYNANSKIEILSCFNVVKKALNNHESFYDMPQMYATSIFRRSIIDTALCTMGRTTFNNSTQDASLGVLGCLLEKNYLYCEIPVGWVGTSNAAHSFRDFKNHASLSNFDYANFSYNLYKHLPNNNILVIGALKAMQNSFCNNKMVLKKLKKLRVNDNSYLLNLIDKNNNKEDAEIREIFKNLCNFYGNSGTLKQKENLFLKLTVVIRKCIKKMFALPKRIKNKLCKILHIKSDNNKISITLDKQQFMPINELNSFIEEKYHADFDNLLRKLQKQYL
ncbi:MAG: glycosyltransferase family 2 protein [Treponema sp.]|uniref:glycosyltransferase family 2 protein n=1 Tax=Treponema sp. TaxID=166 RepID=UPI0025E82BBA|nr:glycosyltransferase family A protein [Treponema sp.]MBQ8679079.1 glycosyltransferase family 2 protein [Treponema sp.]